MNPKVSIVIPTYNRQELLKKAISSCFAGNESLDIEVIVVDDGSVDSTKEYLLKQGDSRIRPFFQEHLGPQVARNRGMKEAKGEYLKFLDDDDELIEGALTKEVDVIEQTGADVSYGNIKVIGPDKASWVFHQGEAFDLISGIFDGTIWTDLHAFLYRRNSLNVSWNEAFTYEQDKEFAIQYASQPRKAVKLNFVVVIRNEPLEKSISKSVKASAPISELLHVRINLIQSGIKKIKSNNRLDKNHIEAAARGIWQWAHMIAAYDLNSFKKAYMVLNDIAPFYYPDRSVSILSITDKLFSPYVTEFILYPLRRIKRLTKINS